MTQAQLADLAGVSLSTVGRVERGLRVSVKKEARIEDALGLARGTIEGLFRGGELAVITEAAESSAKSGRPAPTAAADSPEFWESVRRSVSDEDYEELWAMYLERKALLAELQARRDSGITPGSDPDLSR